MGLQLGRNEGSQPFLFADHVRRTPLCRRRDSASGDSRLAEVAAAAAAVLEMDRRYRNPADRRQ